MALDSTKVVYGISRVFRQDFDNTGTLDVPDPDAQGKFDPGGSWVELGLTQDFLTFRAAVDYAEINADQYADPVARVLESRDVGLAGNLIEVTPANIENAVGFGTVSTQAAGAGTRGYDRYLMTDDTTEQLAAVLADFENPGNGEFGRVFIPKARPSGSVESAFGNRVEATQVPFDYGALPDDTRDPAVTIDIYIYTPAL